jgi:hypothetical protein
MGHGALLGRSLCLSEMLEKGHVPIRGLAKGSFLSSHAVGNLSVQVPRQCRVRRSLLSYFRCNQQCVLFGRVRFDSSAKILFLLQLSRTCRYRSLIRKF